MNKLRFAKGLYNGREVQLDTDKPMSIGRDVNAGIQILDKSASRLHSEVFPVGGLFFVRDLDSKNGTMLNDVILESEELLRKGDIIKIGSTEIIFDTGFALNEQLHKMEFDDEQEDLGNTIEFKFDDLSDIEDENDDSSKDEVKFLHILYKISSILGETTNKNACPDVLDFIIQALPANYAAVFVKQKDNKLAAKFVQTGNVYFKPKVISSVIKKAITENRAILTEDIQNDERFKRNDSVSSSDISSVICAPIKINGITTGVLYLSRNMGNENFTHNHLELVSACALQLGMYFGLSDKSKKLQKQTWVTLVAAARAIELNSDIIGLGEKTAIVANSIAMHLNLKDSARRIIKRAALFYHISETKDNHDRIKKLSIINDFEAALNTINVVQKNISGTKDILLSGEFSPEICIVATAVTFIRKMKDKTEKDSESVINEMIKENQHDKAIISAIKNRFEDGLLYNVTTKITKNN